MRPTIDPVLFISLEKICASVGIVEIICESVNPTTQTSLLRYINVLSHDFARNVRVRIDAATDPPQKAGFCMTAEPQRPYMSHYFFYI